MIQAGLARAQPKRHITITNKALMHLWVFASKGASTFIPKDQWRMSMGVLICRAWGNRYRIEDATGIAHGTFTTGGWPPEAYAEYAKIAEELATRGLVIGGFFHTRPGRGVYLSEIDVKTPIFHQALNPGAFALVFDHTTIGSTSLGLSLHRIDNPNAPLAEWTSHEVLDFMLEGTTLESLTQAVNLFHDPGFPTDTLWEVIKSRVSDAPPPPMPEIRRPESGIPLPIQTESQPTPVPKPENLTTKDLAYYRETWGFDPVKDRSEIDEDGSYFYEDRLILKNDIALNKAGVQVIARVQAEPHGESHNRLGFERGGIRSLIECIHTAIYDIMPEELANFSPQDFESHVHSTEGEPAILPPWEHFVALKSFAAGLVGRGILTTLFEPPTGSPSNGSSGDRNLHAPEWELNGLNYQLSKALLEVAPEIVKPLVTEQVGEIIEQSPEDWIRTHAEPLFLRYKINLIFENTAYLASVENATLKKLLLLFLSAYHWEFYVGNEVGDGFFNFLCEGTFLDELDPGTTWKFVYAICSLIGHGIGQNDAKLEGILGKIFRRLFAREDPQLCDPQVLQAFLTCARDPLGVRGLPSFRDFERKPSDCFLTRLLEAIFQIWEKYKDPYLGGLPSVLLGYFLQKGFDRELAAKFLRLAPDGWLEVNLPPKILNLILNEFQKISPSGDSEEVVRKKIRNLWEHKKRMELSKETG